METKERYYVTDINPDIIWLNKDNKHALDSFGFYFNSEKKAKDKLKELSSECKIYKVIFEGKKLISLEPSN